MHVGYLYPSGHTAIHFAGYPEYSEELFRANADVLPSNTTLAAAKPRKREEGFIKGKGKRTSCMTLESVKTYSTIRCFYPFVTRLSPMRVNAGILWGMRHNCESCLMPFAKDPGKREDERYCSLCFQNGRLCYEGNDVKEFQKVCYAGMRSRGVWPITARLFTFMIRFAPRWKK